MFTDAHPHGHMCRHTLPHICTVSRIHTHTSTSAHGLHIAGTRTPERETRPLFLPPGSALPPSPGNCIGPNLSSIPQLNPTAKGVFPHPPQGAILCPPQCCVSPTRQPSPAFAVTQVFWSATPTQPRRQRRGVIHLLCSIPRSQHVFRQRFYNE